MEEPRRQTVDLERIAWGMLLVWWGIRWLLEFLPNGTGLMGTALILLGLNAARSMRGNPTRRLTTMLGLAALFSGGLLLVSAALPLPIEIPVLGGAADRARRSPDRAGVGPSKFLAWLGRSAMIKTPPRCAQGVIGNCTFIPP